MTDAGWQAAWAGADRSTRRAVTRAVRRRAALDDPALAALAAGYARRDRRRWWLIGPATVVVVGLIQLLTRGSDSVGDALVSTVIFSGTFISIQLTLGRNRLLAAERRAREDYRRLTGTPLDGPTPSPPLGGAASAALIAGASVAVIGLAVLLDSVV